MKFMDGLRPVILSQCYIPHRVGTRLLGGRVQFWKRERFHPWMWLVIDLPRKCNYRWSKLWVILLMNSHIYIYIKICWLPVWSICIKMSNDYVAEEFLKIKITNVSQEIKISQEDMSCKWFLYPYQLKMFPGCILYFSSVLSFLSLSALLPAFQFSKQTENRSGSIEQVFYLHEHT